MANRNTPTHVGKTKLGSKQLLPKEKHPHARGEDTPYPYGRGLP